MTIKVADIIDQKSYTPNPPEPKTGTLATTLQTNRK